MILEKQSRPNDCLSRKQPVIAMEHGHIETGKFLLFYNNEPVENSDRAALFQAAFDGNFRNFQKILLSIGSIDQHDYVFLLQYVCCAYYIDLLHLLFASFKAVR